MLFVFPLNCSRRLIGGWPIEIVLKFEMTCWSPEPHLFPFIGTCVAPRLSDKCLQLGFQFYCISSSRGMGPLGNWWSCNRLFFCFVFLFRNFTLGRFIGSVYSTGLPVSPALHFLYRTDKLAQGKLPKKRKKEKKKNSVSLISIWWGMIRSMFT